MNRASLFLPFERPKSCPRVGKHWSNLQCEGEVYHPFIHPHLWRPDGAFSKQSTHMSVAQRHWRTSERHTAICTHKHTNGQFRVCNSNVFRNPLEVVPKTKEKPFSLCQIINDPIRFVRLLLKTLLHFGCYLFSSNDTRSYRPTGLSDGWFAFCFYMSDVNLEDLVCVVMH